MSCSRASSQAAGWWSLGAATGRSRPDCSRNTIAWSASTCRRSSCARLVWPFPAATFVQADLLDIEFDSGSIDAVASFYVFNHVPRDRLADLLGRVHAWLRPGGLLLTAFGTSDLEGWEGEWLGVPMYFSSFPPPENSRIVTTAGFELLRDEVVEIAEPDGGVAFQWVLAAKHLRGVSPERLTPPNSVRSSREADHGHGHCVRRARHRGASAGAPPERRARTAARRHRQERALGRASPLRCVPRRAGRSRSCVPGGDARGGDARARRRDPAAVVVRPRGFGCARRPVPHAGPGVEAECDRAVERQGGDVRVSPPHRSARA